MNTRHPVQPMNQTMRIQSLLVALVLALMFVAAAPLIAQNDQPREGDKIEWYTVKPGDTLEGLSQRFLGDPRLWPEIYRLNRDIINPNFILPGQRIRMITDRSAAAFALLTEVEKRVERKPEPEPWTSALIGDRLKEKDGVRTFRKSSANLLFEDGSTVTLTEESLIFLKEVKTTLRGTKESIEIVNGQADLSARLPQRGNSDIEIVVSGTTVKPDASAGKTIFTRGRKEDDGARVMVFEGSSSVESAGKAVTVPSGMGTAVKEGQAPSTPEKLLIAPKPVYPVAGDNWIAGKSMQWGAVPNANSYTVEICLDKDCREQVNRATKLTSLSWVPDVMPHGQHYWRVNAVSKSGLDGFSSDATPFGRPFVIAGAVHLTELVTLSGNTQPAEGAKVIIYRDGGDQAADGVDDVKVGDDTTIANGTFRFDNLSAGSYWVVVDSLTVKPNPVRGIVWAEQIRGPRGSICGGGDPIRQNGPCVGGRNAEISDDASSLSKSEHVALVEASTGDIADVFFGFSFDVVVHTRDDDHDRASSRSAQGSLRQFVENSRQIPYGNLMKFVPAVPAQENGRWTITLTKPLPAMDDPGVVIDGLPWLVEGTDVVPLPLIPSRELATVGQGGGSLREAPTFPYLEIAANNLDYGIHATTGSLIRNLSIYGARENVIGEERLELTDVFIGIRADGSVPEVAGGTGLALRRTANAIVNRVSVANQSGVGIIVESPTQGASIHGTDLEIVGSTANGLSGALEIRSNGSSISRSIISNSAGNAVLIGGEGEAPASHNIIADSSITGATNGIVFSNNAHHNLITRSLISASQGTSMLVTREGGRPSETNRFIQNDYRVSDSLAIDIDYSGKAHGSGDGPSATISSMEPCELSSTGARPVGLGAEQGPEGVFLLHGTTCPDTTIELYRKEDRTIRHESTARAAADGSFILTLPALAPHESEWMILASLPAGGTSEFSEIWTVDKLFDLREEEFFDPWRPRNWTRLARRDLPEEGTSAEPVEVGRTPER